MLKSFQNYIYPYIPVPLQNLAVSAYGFLWNRRRFGGIFESTLKEFRTREQFNGQQWQEYQSARIREILIHAHQHVPFYKESFKRAGIDEATLQKIELSQIGQLPFLSKEELRQFGTSTLLSEIREKGGSFYSSSGSTGTPTRILYSYSMHQRISALYEARVRNWAGVTRLDSRGMIGGRRVLPSGEGKPPYYRYNFVEKQVYFSAYHISSSTVANYLKGMKKYNIDYMVGYAMSNYLLARFIKQQGLHAPKMKAVLTSSEKLTPAMRELISDVYQCKTYDAWSGVEWCGLISENEFGQLLLSPDSGLVEIIKPDGQPALPGEEGELVCTGFLNLDQPLIRYRIGDRVRLAKNQIALCGRSFPVIEEIIGRTEDVVVGKDGREMVRFHSLFLDLPNVLRGQVVQEDVNNFVVNVETTGLTQKERESIVHRLKSQLGEVNVGVQEMTSIPLTPNGKFKAVISKVKQEIPS